MADIFHEIDEDLRRDRLVQIWKRYGAVIVTAAVLLVAGTAGSVIWRNWQAARDAQATANLQAAVSLTAAGQPAAAASALAAVAAKVGPNSGPGVLARLYEAAERDKLGDEKGAIALYDSVAASSADPAYRDLATLLSVARQVDTGDPKALEARLAPMTEVASPWRDTAQELTGLLAARAGDRARAKSIFEALSKDATAPADLRSRAAELAAVYGKPA